MLDARGELIGVREGQVFTRALVCYFRRKSRDRKAAHIIKYAVTIVWERASSDLPRALA